MKIECGKLTMPKLSPQRMRQLGKERELAYSLYRRGFSMRAVGEKIGRKRTWVWTAVRAIQEKRNKKQDNT
jgi:chromosomal replication initiation ATPase DnaA